MVNATFNNIEVIAWQVVLLVEETEPEKNKNMLQVTDTKGYIQYNLTCE